MKHVRAKILPGVQSPDIKVVSNCECPYSALYAVSPLGEFELRRMNLTHDKDGSWVVCNLKLCDLIDQCHLDDLIIT